MADRQAVPAQQDDLDALVTQLTDSLAGAPRDVLERMLHEVETGDCYRDTVVAMLEEKGVFLTSSPA